MTYVMAQGQTFLNFDVNCTSSPVSDKNRLIQLFADDSWTLSIGAQHNLSKTLTAALGGGIVFNGNAPVDQVLQGSHFKGDYGANRILMLGGSLAWRF